MAAVDGLAELGVTTVHWGIKQVLLSPDRMSLIILDGTVIPPRPLRPWRGQAERPR